MKNHREEITRLKIWRVVPPEKLEEIMSMRRVADRTGARLVCGPDGRPIVEDRVMLQRLIAKLWIVLQALALLLGFWVMAILMFGGWRLLGGK